MSRDGPGTPDLSAPVGNTCDGPPVRRCPPRMVCVSDIPLAGTAPARAWVDSSEAFGEANVVSTGLASGSDQ